MKSATRDPHRDTRARSHQQASDCMNLPQSPRRRSRERTTIGRTARTKPTAPGAAAVSHVCKHDNPSRPPSSGQNEANVNMGNLCGRPVSISPLFTGSRENDKRSQCQYGQVLRSDDIQSGACGPRMKHDKRSQWQSGGKAEYTANSLNITIKQVEHARIAKVPAHGPRLKKIQTKPISIWRKYHVYADWKMFAGCDDLAFDGHFPLRVTLAAPNRSRPRLGSRVAPNAKKPAPTY